MTPIQTELRDTCLHPWKVMLGAGRVEGQPGCIRVFTVPLASWVTLGNFLTSLSPSFLSTLLGSCEGQVRSHIRSLAHNTEQALGQRELPSPPKERTTEPVSRVCSCFGAHASHTRGLTNNSHTPQGEGGQSCPEPRTPPPLALR